MKNNFLLNLINSLLPDNRKLNDYHYIVVKQTGYKEWSTLNANIFVTREETEDWLRNHVSNEERSEWVVYRIDTDLMAFYSK